MTTKLQPIDAVLDPSITLRYANWDDIEAVTQLIYDVCEADGDTTVALTIDEMKEEWNMPGFNIETDGIIAATADGRVVGYEEFVNEHEHSKLRTDGYVHPQFKGLGIATSMMQLIEERARKEIALAAPGARVYLHSTLDNHDESGKGVHEDLGFSPIRYHWRMQTDLESAPPAVEFPKGIELRPFDREQHAHALWQAHNEAWRDLWDSHEIPFDEWVEEKFEDSGYDPSLWMVAWDGDQIAGFSLNRFRMGIGWIRHLGVRRPWRKQGLGYSLLIHSFGEFHKRGMKAVGLGVDAQSPTGATRLYQKAGMYIASEFVTYEKELRPGRELERQE